MLIVAEWDRATRSMLDGIEIIERIAARGAMVKVLDKSHLDLTTTMGKGILTFLSAIAQDERERIAKRAREGRAVARTNGVRLGRKPKLTDEQKAEALTMLKGKNRRSARTVARLFGVHHATISRLSLQEVS